MADSEDPSNFFVKHRSTVKLALKDNLSLIVDELYEVGLIKPYVYYNIKDRRTIYSSSQIVDMVIDCLKVKMELNSDHMKTFHRIISSPDHKPHYDDILLKLMVEPVESVGDESKLPVQSNPEAITLASAKIVEDSRTGIQQAPTTNDKESEEVVRKVVQDQTIVDIYIARLNFLGLPRSGKSTTMKRLIGEIVDMVTAGWTKELESTGTAERNQAFVCRKVSKQFIFGWSKFDLSRETAILYYLMEQAVKDAAHKQKSEKSDAQKVPSQSVDQKHIEDDSSVETHTDISNVLSIFQKAVANEEWDMLKDALNDTVYWINTDTGGQTAFLELMSRFILGPSLNLIFSPLTDSLEKEYKIYATCEEGKCTEKEDSTVKLEDTLFQALASITCMEVPYQSNEKSKEAAKKDEVPNTMSKAMFVGTFRDKVSPDEFLKRDQNLREKIEQSEFCSKRIVEYSSEKHLILALNNKSGGQEEVDKMREIFERKFKKFKKICIPAPWLMLSICMRHTKQRTMTFQQCEEIAGKLGIASKALKEVLQFLHYRVGVLLYYPEVEEFENIIILDIQLVFEVTTQLIKKTFTFEKVDYYAANLFKEKAQFSLADIDDAAAGNQDDSIPVKKLVHLLEHHKILAKLDGQDVYFMPCILKNATEQELKNPKCSDHIAPLMIRYKCGYMPLGIFSTLITALLSKKKEDKWNCVGDLRRNKVEFQVGADSDCLTLIGHPTFMEVNLYRVAKQHNEKVCSDIRATLENTLKEVHFCMKYCSSVNIQYRFKCPSHPGEDHLSELRDNYLLCLNDPKKSCRSIPKEEKFTIWFGEGASSDSEDPLYTYESLKEEIEKSKPKVVRHWNHKEYCKSIEYVIWIANENEYYIATTYLKAPNIECNVNVAVRISSEGRVFVGTMSGHSVGLIKTENQGSRSQDEVMKHLNLFPNAKCIISAGICYGFPQEVKLGDVIVSDKIINYSNPRISKQSQAPRGEVRDVSPNIRGMFCGSLKTVEAMKVTKDRFSKFRRGAVVSCSTLIDRESFQDEVYGVYKDLHPLGGEMEGGVLLDLQQLAQRSVIIIKGICDFAAGKNEKWQITSAKAAFHLLEYQLDQIPQNPSDDDSVTMSSLKRQHQSFEMQSSSRIVEDSGTRTQQTANTLEIPSSARIVEDSGTRTQQTDDSPVQDIGLLDEGKFIYSNDAMEWKWKEHSFSMTFQSESLPTGTNESIVEISVSSCGEDYVLPELTKPASMFFSIECQHKFKKNVLLSIEHFSAETSNLSFVISSDHHPPFQFELLSGGEFNTKRYGKIEIREFCIVGAVMTRIRTGRWPNMLYYCALFTSLAEKYTWIVDIYITKNSATYKSLIEKETNKKLNTYTVADVKHTLDDFELNISMDKKNNLDGWQLAGDTSSIRILRRRIDTCHGIPPPANFKIIWDASKTKELSMFSQEYKIKGVRQESPLSLTLTPPTNPAATASSSTIRRSPRIAAKNLPILSMPSHSVMQDRSQMPTTFVGPAQDIGKGSCNITSLLDEVKFIYSNDAMEWNWKEHNFSMTFQSESLPTGTNESIVEITVTSGGEDYVLPELTKPVSMFFSIECQHKFKKNVLLSIEHFSAETSDLSFVISSDRHPPFQFELLSGGEFSTKRYGKIERREFCIVGEVMTRIRTGRWPNMLYYCALFTSLAEKYAWIVYIYITKNSATYKSLIEKETDKKLNTYTVADVKHTLDDFELNVSMDKKNNLDGWQLAGNTSSIRILRRRIDTCHGIPPPANFKIIWDASKTKELSMFSQDYKIEGVDQENPLSLTLTPPKNPAATASSSTIRRSPRIAAKSSSTLTGEDLKKVYETIFDAREKWYQIGLQLKVDANTLDSIKDEEKSYEEKLLRMLKYWLRAGIDRSWEALDKALRNKTVDRPDVADKLPLM